MTEFNVPDDFSDSSAAESVTDRPLPPVEDGGPRGLDSGEWRRLDPQFIPFQRVASLIAAAVTSLVLLAGAMAVWLATQAPPWADALLLPAWLLLTAVLGSSAYAWPPLEYRYTAYMLDDRGLEIRGGVVWRTVMSVPRSRVQHIDVSQGPLERVYGLGRLVIYTAGTDHSRVELPGLAHAVALQLRDRLLPKGEDDAV